MHAHSHLASASVVYNAALASAQYIRLSEADMRTPGTGRILGMCPIYKYRYALPILSNLAAISTPSSLHQISSPAALRMAKASSVGFE